MQHWSVPDPAGDLAPKTVAAHPEVDILAVSAVESPERFAVTLELGAAPDLEVSDYDCWLRQREPGQPEVLVILELYNGKSGKPAVQFDVGPRNVTLAVPMLDLGALTWHAEFTFGCETSRELQGEGTVFSTGDATTPQEFRWAWLRRLGADPAKSGIGPSLVRTIAEMDPAGDVVTNSNGLQPGTGPAERPGTDFRDLWVWQDDDGLWVEFNLSAPADPQESAGLYYRVPETPPVTKLGLISYHYDSNRAFKDWSDRHEPLPATVQPGNGVRLHIPWRMLNDRENEGWLDFWIATRSSDGTGHGFIDGFDALTYRIH